MVQEGMVSNYDVVQEKALPAKIDSITRDLFNIFNVKDRKRGLNKIGRWYIMVDVVMLLYDAQMW